MSHICQIVRVANFCVMKCPVACEASVVLDGILHSSPQFVFAVTFRFLLQLCNGGHVSVPAVPFCLFLF